MKNTTFINFGIFVSCLVKFCHSIYVETSDGWVRGKVSDEAISFLGIPYAEPPQRWENPRRPRRWSGVWDARYARPMCLQPACGPEKNMGVCLQQMSEDCLYLNVYLPLDARQGSNKAVMVFIHGGNFISQTGGSEIYNGERFVNKGDVILVTMNYRLGALGFLVTASGTATGNYGIRDQRMALEWVNRHIALFGGDPNRVTLFGESAGAVSTAIHMISRKADAYFQRAIIQSLPFGIPLKTYHQAYTQGNRFCRVLNCSPEDIDCLRRKSPMDILRAQRRARVTAGKTLQRFMPWTPHLDGNEVPLGMMRAVSRGLLSTKPLIIGTTADEGDLFVYGSFRAPMNAISYSALLLLLKPNKALEWMTRYHPRNARDARRLLSELIGDLVFTCPARHVAHEVSMNTNENVWMYVFNNGLSFLNGTNFLRFCQNRACHGAELPFLFQSSHRVGLNLTAEETQLADEMLIYWTNFAKVGNPNGNITDSSLGQWPEYDINSSYLRSVIRFQIPESDLVLDYLGAICDQFSHRDFSA